MSEFVKALPLSELPPGTCRQVQLGATAVAVYNVAGTVYATSNVCIHRGGPLGQGMLDGNAGMCPWHAWSWDVTTGENTANGELKMACYEVRVEDGPVYVKVS